MKKYKHQTGFKTVIISIAFLVAASYCTFEMLPGFANQSKVPHHHDGSHQDHDHNFPAPGNDDGVTCCFTLQTSLASKLNIWFGSVSTQLFPFFALSTPELNFVIGPFREAVGLGSPTLEPIPTRPFYLTTFANHAPPRFHS